MRYIRHPSELMKMHFLSFLLLTSKRSPSLLRLASNNIIHRPRMSSYIPDSKDWNPPAKIEDLFAASEGNKFASINSPVAGARSEKDLSKGTASVQLYSLATPNGM